MPTVVIVGAGAAGVAAGRRLAGRGVPAVVLEAASRVGGRAHTAHARGLPLDLGCGWLHSADRNPWAALARATGFTVDETPPPWSTQAGNHGFSAADQADFHAAMSAFEARVAAYDGPDRAAADLLDPAGRWNPLLDALASYISGAEYDRVSLSDYRAYEAAATDANHRVAEGYGALVAATAAPLDVRLDTPAVRIDHGGSVVRVETPRGTIEADAAIVTVSTAVLAAEAIAFAPAIPDILAAAAHLPLGLADKVHLHLEGADEFPSDSNLLGRTDTSATGSYHLRPFGRPTVEAYLGGRHADALEREGEGAAAAFAIDELAALLGSSMRRRLIPLAASRWRAAPHVRGSYSYAEPGHRDARATLAAPVGDRLFFAGEACSPCDFSTAHGAYATGIAAADAVLARLG